MVGRAKTDRSTAERLRLIPLHVSSTIGYAGVALLVGAEAAGLPVPGEASLIAWAVLASQGRSSLPLVIAVAAGAAIVGDNVGYAIGRCGGRWLLTRPGPWLRNRARLLARGEAFFVRNGAKAVFLGRWVPWVRVTTAWLAGANRMRWGRFLFWNALGGVTWATSIGIAAYFLGHAAAAVLGAAGMAALGLLILAAVGVLLARSSHRPRAEAAPDS
jgi:membrane-associated protein